MSKQRPKYTGLVAKYRAQKKIDNQDIMKLDDATQREIIQQYENIRKSGVCNMFNYTAVKYAAKQFGWTALYNFIKDGMNSYQTILLHFSKLMKKFDIKQD